MNNKVNAVKIGEELYIKVKNNNGTRQCEDGSPEIWRKKVNSLTV